MPYGVKTWKEWSGYQENLYKYVLDDVLESYITQLRSHLNGVKKVARIVGLSGVGKTRLAFEAFRPPDDLSDIDQMTRSRQVIYLDAAVNSSDLSSIISTWRTLGLRGTIIVDNCTPDLHSSLRNEVEHAESKLNLLTLDFNPERYHSDHPYIEIKQVSNEIIKGIIAQAYPGISEEDSERIVGFAQGFPKIAVLLAKARVNEDDDIGSLRDDTLIGKLLWGRDSKDPIKHKVISACALFEYLGYEEEVSVQRKFIAENICGLDNYTFYESCQYFIERGILDIRGRFIRVTPLPLAIRLATDWWKSCPPERALSIVTAEMPNGMAEALCDQIAKLHFLPKAKEITFNLCGEQAPFGQAEVLNSEKGSRLFRSLVEVNPEATVIALERVFGQMGIDELLEVGPGRRNLIWSLEKLCFWENTFDTAARILLMFAAAENESWGNNATAQFLQLFHFVLSGTQASPESRLSIIDYALNSDIPEIQLLGVEALGHAIQTHHFTRMAGVEKQGSRPVQQEWRPNTWDDVFDYWKRALERLTKIAINNKPLSQKACDKIAENIYGLVSYGRMEDLEKAIKLIIDNNGSFWPEALNSLIDTIKYEGPKLPEKERERLQTWCNWMQPDTFIENLRLKVSIPIWDHIEDEDTEKYIDVSENEAKEFARFTLTNHFHDLLESMPELLYGEQRQGYIFGYELARIIDEPKDLINRAKQSLVEVSSYHKINFSFVGGMLKALQEKESDLVNQVLKWISSGNLCHYTVDLIRYLEIKNEHLEIIVDLLRDNLIEVNSLLSLSYGGVLKHFTPKIILEFISEIQKKGSNGVAVGWEILYTYTYGDKDKFLAAVETFKCMILSSEIIFNRKISNYEICNVLNNIYKITGDGEESKQFTKLLTKKVVTSLNEKYVYEQIGNIREYVNILFKYDWENSWPKIGEVLLSEEKQVVFNIIDIIEPEISNFRNSWPLSNVPLNVLKSWCREHSKGPELLSSVIPVIGPRQKGVEINPLAIFLVKEYGNQQRILSNINIRMRTFSWSGSLIPYYENLIYIYKEFEKLGGPNVRDWAKENILYTFKEIEKEKQREAENELGL